MMTTNEKGRSCRHGKKKFLLIPVFIVGFIALKSAAVMWIWNGLVPDLFHGPEVTYVQALGLVVLAKLLVGFGGPRGFGHRHRFGHHWGGFGHRLDHMTDEERQKLRDHLRHHFGHED